MTRTFVMLPEFDKQWANLGLTDKDLNRLQLELLENPQKGDVIQGTGGLRKLRFAFENRAASIWVRCASPNPKTPAGPLQPQRAAAQELPMLILLSMRKST